jgi:methionyl-tRNA formyltransferase
MTKILYLGQKPIGESCFKFLINNQKSKKIEIVGVVSNSSISNWWGSNKIYEYCKDEGIPFIDNFTRSNQEILELIEHVAPDFLISVQHNWVLPPEILNSVNGNALNLHLAPLPNYKGYNCANHCILNGDKVFGVTMHWMSEEVDEGDIACRQDIEVLENETAYSLYKKTVIAGEQLFYQVINLMMEGGGIPRERMIGKSRFYTKDALSKLRQINNLIDINEVLIKARAFHFPPNEPAYFLDKNKRYYIYPSNSDKS